MKSPLLIFVLCSSLFASGQKLVRQSIGANGTSHSVEGTTLQQITGQPYHTKTQRSNNTVFRPGFSQPILHTEIINSSIQVLIWPNPSQFSFYLESSDTLTEASLMIRDERGRIIYEQQVPQFKRLEIPCFTWDNGAYLISLIDKNKNMVSAKLVKEQ